ncbi:MAG: MotA/TolQ/ExbB proton channel family protein [Victivallales bacterium]|nr:MotA/TolQ/ExbB proton channel family protein [Victivallales bacterium]
MNFLSNVEIDVVCWILLGVFIVSTFLFFHRFFYLHSINLDSEGFMMGMKNNIKNDKIVEAITLCRDTNTPVASVCESILSQKTTDIALLRHAADEAALIEIPKLQRNFNLIATLGRLAPMLGFFDTVICFLKMFREIASNTDGMTMSISKISPYISNALIATAIGIAVGMVIYLFTAILSERCHAIVNDMEKTAMELVNVLTEPKDISARLNGDIAAKPLEDGEGGGN